MSKRSHDKRQATCYMCERPATSKEHVPPDCFFPSQRDLPDMPNLRRNLITVPSCDEHNLKKSGDDEYLLAILLAHHENNPIAERMFNAKVINGALERRPHLARTHFRGLSPVLLGDSLGGRFFVDQPRFNTAMERIARGIYFYHYKKHNPLPCKILSPALTSVNSPRSSEVNAALQQWRRYSQPALAGVRRYGDNPSVFYYCALQREDAREAAIHLVFYEGVTVEVLFSNAID